MVGDFFRTDGRVIYDVNDLMQIVFGKNLWIKPTALTETLNFIPSAKVASQVGPDGAVQQEEPRRRPR